MNNNKDEDSGRKIITLVGEIYRSILTPERFIEVLEMWHDTITNNGDFSQETLDLLEAQLITAVPLLENSFKDIVNQDDLVLQLNEEDNPCLLLTVDRVVVGSNQLGRDLFNFQDGDRIDYALMENGDQAKFNAILRAGMKNGDSDKFEILNFSYLNDSGKLMNTLVGVRIVRATHSKINYIILSAMGVHLSERSRQALKSAFSLTDTEIELVELLVQGNGPKAISQFRQSREDTVKKQLRAVREKTHCTSTTALICLVASFSQVALGQSLAKDNMGPRMVTNSSNQTYTMPTKNKLLKLEEGIIEYQDIGDDTMRPVVVIHSTMVGFVLPPEFEEQMNERGYRLLVPFRPGYGISVSKKPFSIDNHGEFLNSFITKLGLKKFGLIGGTIGFLHSLKLGNIAGDRTVCSIGCAAYLPVGKQKLIEEMPTYQRAVLDRINLNRTLAKFLILGGYRLFIQFGSHALLSRLLKKSKSDVEAIESSANAGLFSVGLKAAAAQGVDALLDDTGLIMQNWQQIVDDAIYPIKIMIGEDDSIFNRRLVENYCQENPKIELEFVEDVGQLMLYSKPKLIADKFADQFDKQEGWR